MLKLRVSLSGLLTASDQGSLTTFGELFNISALDPLLPTLLIATLCLCALLTILYYSLVVAWEVFWASRRSPLPLDPSAEVVLTSCRDAVRLPSVYTESDASSERLKVQCAVATDRCQPATSQCQPWADGKTQICRIFPDKKYIICLRTLLMIHA